MSDRSRLNKDDRELFRSTVGPVQPVEQDKVLTHSTKPKPTPTQTRANEGMVLAEMASGEFDLTSMETGDELLYRRPGLQNKLLKKLRRGQFSINAELDLHGLTIPLAKAALSEFLANSQAVNHRCIRIIHGKGLGSKEGKPILKNQLSRWLQQHDEVLAFCSARPIDGGTGAVYVLLKRLKKIMFSKSFTDTFLFHLYCPLKINL